MKPSEIKVGKTYAKMDISYCRFESALDALEECKEALDNYGTAELSDSEKRAARQIIKLCKTIGDDYAE